MATPKMNRGARWRVIGLWDALEGFRYLFGDLFAGEGSQCIRLGKARRCDIQVNDCFASDEHCEIELVNGLFVLRDLDSTNGTMINRRPVQDDVELQPDMYISIGGAVFVVVGQDEQPELHARTHSSFLRQAELVYGSDRKAAPKVKKGRSTIRRAVEAKKGQN